MRARPVGRLGLALAARAGEHDLGGMGAEMAYRFLFAFFPLLIVTVALLGLVGDAVGLDDLVLSIIARAGPFMPGPIHELLTGQVERLLEVGSGTFLTIGIFGTLWGASGGVQTLIKALNRAYGVRPRPMWRRSLLALGFAIVIPPAGLALLVLAVVGRDLARLLGEALGLGTLLVQVLAVLQVPALVLMLFLGLAAVYHLLPHAAHRFRDALPGAAFATAAWMLLTAAFGLYVTNFGRFDVVYGSFGAIIVFMLWLYFVSVVILIGAELNALLTPKDRGGWA